jgi:hypothetical protein
MKKTLILASVLFAFSSVSTAACPHATPTNSKDFCSSFQTAARCHCTASGLPLAMCQNVKLLHQRLISTFGTLERTCAFQRNTSVQDCIDSWRCSLYGGKNAKGNLCSGTGKACS